MFSCGPSVLECKHLPPLCASLHQEVAVNPLLTAQKTEMYQDRFTDHLPVVFSCRNLGPFFDFLGVKWGNPSTRLLRVGWWTPKRYVEALTPGTCECVPIRK